MSDRFQRDVSSNSIYDYASNCSQSMELPDYNQGGEVHVVHHHRPLQQHVMSPQPPQFFNSINSQSMQNQQEDSRHFDTYQEGRNDVSTICQNVSASIHELKNRASRLEHDLRRSRASNNQLSKLNETLTTDLHEAKQIIASLKETVKAKEADIVKSKQEIARTKKSNTDLRSEIKETKKKLETANTELSLITKQKSDVELNNRELLETNLHTSLDNSRLKKDLTTCQQCALNMSKELGKVQNKLEVAQSKISELERDNFQCSAKITSFIKEENERQNLYKNSYLYKLIREDEEGESEPEPELARKRSVCESDGGGFKKQRNEDSLPTVRVEKQISEEEFGNSERYPHLQHNEMLEGTGKTPELRKGNPYAGGEQENSE